LWVEGGMVLTGENEVMGEKRLTVTVCPPQFSSGLIRDRDKK